ncbi:hypothetical protein UFOVP1255_12 [uncultured Caudovirales phage]|uniref:Uncharacterized protein n=1 Tax=uncultured Caudovirales phage TaxID=2100421 RepID=A0A6J5SPS9_9CAUD|nr:hypothetical protein UFOVP973_7 [uncultured Caudovirales phage]CAB4194044.1 hypothetical protein UFOVP1255_12 [uncultured Caudovirales phage]CAB4216884.1 hypothetical protein UFOVP1496_11 [uncultured Caudovirales phage]
MPVKVQGLIEVTKAMRKLAPDMDKELTKNVRAILKPVVKTARSYATPSIPGLSNWVVKGRQERKIGPLTSQFQVFPKYNAIAVRAGIKYTIRKSRPNRKGFTALYRIVNESRAGAIYEWAGRTNFSGDGSNKSDNPNAPYQFNLKLNSNSELKGEGKMRGRLIYRAWYEDNQRATKATIKAIDETLAKFARYVTASSQKTLV